MRRNFDRWMLRGFQRMHVQLSKSKQVTGEVLDGNFVFWSPDTNASELQRGQCGVEVGASST